jgi:hypothetical protein
MTNLMIMMPTGGHIDTPCVHALLGLTQALNKRGIGFALRTYEWSDLVISRNYLMSVFLAKKEFTHALLLDSDMSFEPELFFTLLDFDAEFSIAPYPQRRMPWVKFRAAIEREAAKPEDQRANTAAILAECLRYNVAQVFDAGEPWPLERRGDFRKIPGAGTGFMVIKRSVPEKMAASGAAQPVTGMNGPGYPEADFHDFFSHMRGRGGAIMHGEDTSFCRRWIKGCDGEIWAYEKSRITHHGNLSYQGDYRYGEKPA